MTGQSSPVPARRQARLWRPAPFTSSPALASPGPRRVRWRRPRRSTTAAWARRWPSRAARRSSAPRCTAGNTGAMFVFTSVDGTWRELQRLQAAGGRTNDLWGSSVGLSGDLAIGGTNSALVAGLDFTGYAAVFGGLCGFGPTPATTSPAPPAAFRRSASTPAPRHAPGRRPQPRGSRSFRLVRARDRAR